MSCDSIRGDLMDLLMGGTSKQTREGMERHFMVCPDCDRERRELGQLWQSMGYWADLDVPERARSSLLARLAGEPERGRIGAPVGALVEGLLATLMFWVVGTLCPIPGVCHFFESHLALLEGTRWSVLFPLLAGSVMGLPSFALMALVRKAYGWRPDRSLAWLSSGLFLIATGSLGPRIGGLGYDLPSLVGWVAGLVLATVASTELLLRLAGREHRAALAAG